MKNNLKYRLYKSCIFLGIAGIMVGLTFSGCSTSSDSTTSSSATTSDSSKGYPSDLAVASPTASESSSKPNLKADGRSLPKLSGTVSADDTYSSKVSVYETIIAAANSDACKVTLPALQAVSDPSCYGPALDYQSHPDATGGSPSSGQLPTGDLGIWTSAQGSNSEACTAAKINALTEETANSVDYVMLMAASMVCIMKTNGTSLPATDGTSVTLTSELDTAIKVNNPNVTITTATIENLADVTDSGGTTRDVYKYSIVASDATGANTTTSTSYMKHMPTATDNSTYIGRIWTQIDGIGGANFKNGYAVTYEKASSTSLKYRMVGADYDQNGTGMFTSNGDLDVTSNWIASMSQGIININPETGLGNFSYGWQAGYLDDKARIFNGFTQASSGCGFFGYGDSFNTSTGALTDNVIDGFICNWAGPGNSHAMTATSGKAQKQCMTVNTTTNVFEVDSSKNSITYAPTVSCDSASSTLGIKLTSETTYSTSAITNNLVTLSTDTDYANYTAPSEPTLPSGL